MHHKRVEIKIQEKIANPFKKNNLPKYKIAPFCLKFCFK